MIITKMNMGFLQVKLFLVFLLISAVYSENQIPTCGNNSFYIQYPFRLLQEGQKPHHKSHHHHQDDNFILKCNSQGFVVLNLPFSGDFYVRDINYFEQKIQIYDPGNCLPGRVKNLSLSSSPFVAEEYQNYTFFSCPPERVMVGPRNFSVISCLSNSTASIFATSKMSMVDEIKNLTGCKVIYSLNIPMKSPFDEDNGIDDDLQLAWNDPSCKEDCKG